MARKASPTNQDIDADKEPEQQLVTQSRQKPVAGEVPVRDGTQNSNRSSEEEIEHLKEQLAQRDTEIARLSRENQQLAKETDQRATELQIINNIGQTLTEGLDLDITLERVGERLREALNIKSLGIVAFDPQAGSVISNYFYHYGRRFAPQFSISDYKFSMRLASRVGYKPWVVNTNIEKYWKKFGTDILTNWTEIPKAFVMVPMLSGRELVGSISLGDYENENAFENLPLNLLETIASNIGTTIQNVRLFDETQRLLKETEQRATELQIINNIGHTLTEGLDLNSMIERVAERLHEALRVDNIAITIINPNTGQVIAQNKIFHSTNPSFASDRFSLDKFKSLMRLSARGGNRSWVMNTNAEKSWRKYAGNVLEGDNIPKSFVALPLLVGRSSIGGIIFADYEKENAFIDLPVRMLETIAYNMGTGIQNVLLFDETQYLLKQTVQRATELQIINNIGQTLTEGGDLNTMTQHVGERIQEALQVSNLVVSLLDKKTGHVLAPYMVRNGKQVAVTEENVDLNRYKLAVRASARAGGASWVVNTNAEKSWRKFWINPVDNEVPKSFVSMPFLVGREVIGGITIADYENENAFSDLSVNLLETIASNMGTAVQNVRLFDETQRLLKETEQRAAELQIINNIGQTLTEGLDLDSTLERVGDRLREVLKIESIGIVANEIRTGLVISSYVYLQGKRIHPNYPAWGKNMFGMRFAARVGGKPLVVTTNVKKNWRRFIADVPEWAEIPKAFVIVPLLADRELVGSITIADYENENAFANLPFDLLQTIASNMGTAIQNAYLFNETQRLLKETEQRAAELQIINNIGQTLTDGLDLNSALERVGERLLTSLKLKNIGIVVFDPKSDLGISHYLYVDGKRVSAEHFSLEKFRSCIRLSMRGAGRSWVVNTNAEKIWRKYGAYEDKTAKSFVMLPLLAGKEVIGGITILDYERENAFSDLSIGLIETIASNMGTTIQNVRLFDETQRLLKETEQRATELQIINNIGQTLTEGGDLENMIQRVGERLQEALNINNVAISIFDKENERIIAPYMVRNGIQIKLAQEHYDLKRYKMMIRAWARAGGRGTSWVINKDIDKLWRRGWLGSLADDVPKSLVALPLLAGGEIIGGISLADYEKENAFTDLSVNLLETIASNMGTAVQNVRLFEETKRLFAEAEESRASAVQANKAKSTFLANMSHELRTPLNAIMGFTRIVKKKAEGALPEKQIENLDKVLISSEHLLGLINTVLDIAKIEAGRMDVIPAKFSVSTLADQCATLASPLLKPNVTLEKQVDETIGFIFSDQDKIKQVVLNLLSNAAKFTHEGNILLSVQKFDEQNVNISVTDSGIGISEEALGRVFEEFQQADTSTTREYGGTGLGLAISRNLARLLGGNLIATSELGKGSTFTLTVPIRYEKKTAASSDPKPDSTQSAESQPDDGPTKQNRSRDAMKTILIVEDTDFNIDVLTQLLNEDYNLLIARDGAQGVDMAQQNNPDLILMDVSLPVLDGYEATRRIREAKISVPIIGLSAHAMSGDAEKAKEAGCNDYLTKPVDEILLIKKLNQFLR